MKKILLDTNAYTRLLLGDRAVLEEIGKSDKVYIPTVVLGELFAGFKGGMKEVNNKKLLEQFLAKPQVEILPISKETAEVFGEIKYDLIRAGTPLPINDVWIACCAVEVGATVITYDKHFSKISKVRVWE